MLRKKSFFEKIADSFKYDNEEEVLELKEKKEEAPFEEEEAQLSVDVYQTPTDIIVQAMVAGVKPEDLNLEVGREYVSIKGKREENKSAIEKDYLLKELYWGAFSRLITLPCEVEPEEAEAIVKQGLLIIKVPKIDKNKKSTLKVKSI